MTFSYSNESTVYNSAMTAKKTIKDGARCRVVNGAHAGASGTIRDIKTSATGHVTITVVQKNGERFKTLARNVTVI